MTAANTPDTPDTPDTAAAAAAATDTATATARAHSATLADLCRRAPVIPVLVIDRAETAADLAAALVRGGLPVLEVTLRTPAALAAIAAMAHVPGAILGAGTVLGGADAAAARDAGARFAVSPGATDGLLEACADLDLPLLPGAATASEAMRLRERGYRVQKFFPAAAIGGPAGLRALSGPLPDLLFCPTGGIDHDSAPGYLALPNVACVGGSWVTPRKLVENREWAAITALARQAAGLSAGRAAGSRDD